MKQMIDRISFHFNDRCPHKCAFCYMPFDREGVGTLNDWFAILERIAEFSPRLLSFAGGDPLVYSDFYELLGGMNKNCYVNLITSGYYLRQDLYERVSHKVDCVCLPLDEAPSSNFVQRLDGDTFERFESNLDFMLARHKNFTINTLLTPANRNDLASIAAFMVSKGLSIWNLYQFWPFDFIRDKELFALDDATFLNAVTDVTQLFSDQIDIRGWKSEERQKGYFFVTSLGKVYTVDKDNANRYAFIGSIFDDDIYNKWIEHNSPDQAVAKFHQIVDREIAKLSLRVDE